jgi:hypothetical protein
MSDDAGNGMLNPYGYIQAVIDRHVDVTGMTEYRVTEAPAVFHGKVHGDAFTKQGESGMVLHQFKGNYHIHIHGLLLFNTYEDCALFLMEDACYKAEHPDAETPN